MDYIDFARTWVVAHAEFLLTWLIAALVVMLLAWIEIRRATRRAAAMTSGSPATKPTRAPASAWLFESE